MQNVMEIGQLAKAIGAKALYQRDGEFKSIVIVEQLSDLTASVPASGIFAFFRLAVAIALLSLGCITRNSLK